MTITCMSLIQELTRLTFATVVLAAASAFSAPQRTAGSSEGLLEVLISDTYGKPIRSSEIAIISTDSGKTVRHLSGPGSISLPYGTYLVRGRASIHERFERKIVLQQPHLLVLVAFAFAHYGESPLRQTALTGHVKNLPTRSDGVYWIRIVSVFGEFAIETRIDEGGRFEFKEVPYGEYFVLVLRDFQVLTVQRFTKTVQHVEVLIDLGVASPGVR